MSAFDNALTPEQRAKIAEQLGDAKPASPGLIVSFGESVRNCREHDHPTWEDLYCLNLVSYMGERMGPVLRRLLDAEAETEGLRARVAELETEREKLVRWHGEDSKTITGLVARVDRHRARLVALQNDALSMRGSLAPADGDRKVPFELGETLTPAVDWLIARVAELEAAQGTVFRASHDSIVMGLYTSREAAQAHCEAKVQQEEPAGSIRHLSWSADDIGPDAEYELHITPAETGGLIRGTGYVVTPLEVASAYDPDGDA
ncbi:hypothetical protein [Streptomyces sp. NPDC056188]|uniref:hypothetical protein n=1 Tax=Streptomyces sp. NPDC056188 TaxID=3345740 RepID=UPI0035D946DC